MKLIKIPEDKYYEYRIQAMFDCYKWDPQFCDSNTLSKHILILTQKENEEIIKLTKSLDKETRLAEEYLNQNRKLAKKLALPKQILKQIPHMQTYDKTQNIRLMRYDFHPSTDNHWVVTEVNSDCPGGFAESSLLPDIARKMINMPELEYHSFGEKMVDTINNKLNKKGTIMMVHCTCFSDDRQVMQYLGDRLEKEGYKIIYGAADHIEFKDKKAYCILDNNQESIDLIFRFTPLEWLIQMKPRRWDGYFNTTTISCNHPISIYAQSKRFPFVWKDLKKGYTHVAENDIALAKITPCFENGKSAIMTNLINGFGGATTEVHVFRSLGYLNLKYILLYLKSPTFIEYATKHMTGTAGQKRVPTEVFANYYFPLPPLEEQHRIVAKVNELIAGYNKLIKLI